MDECGQKEKLKVGVPMVWQNQKHNPNDCYFCMRDLKVLIAKRKKTWIYPNLESARLPVTHCEDVSIPQLSY